MAAPMPVREERFIANRDLRITVGEGEGREVVEVKVGKDLPPNVSGRLDVLIRNGYVIRFDENGVLDPRSYPFAKTLRIPIEPPAHVRGFLARARMLAQTMTLEDGRRVRVFAGKPDGAERELFISGGKAYPVLRGAPDSLTAREMLRARGTLGASRVRGVKAAKQPPKKRRRKARG